MRNDEEEPPRRWTDDELAALIRERLAEIEAGTAKLVDGKKAVEQIRAELRERRAQKERLREDARGERGH